MNVRSPMVLPVALLLGAFACAEAESSKAEGDGAGGAGGAGGAPVTPGVVHLALSVHLEGFRENEGTPPERLFKYGRHVEVIDAFTEAFASQGAKLTYEPEDAYLIGEDLYRRSTGEPDRTTLAERVAAGHFAAPHADLHGATVACPKVHAASGGVGAYTDANAQCADGVRALELLRRAFTSVGLDEPRYVSGVCTEADWIALAREAGFDTVGGVVGWCARTVAPDVLAEVGEAYDVIHGGTCTSPATCHQHLPFEEAARSVPWRTSDVTDWLRPDPAGALTIVPTIGDPRCLSEEAAAGTASFTACAFDDADETLFFEKLDAVVAAAAAEGVDRSFVLTVSVGGAANEPAELERFRALAARLASDYVAAGAAVWGSTHEAAAIAAAP